MDFKWTSAFCEMISLLFLCTALLTVPTVYSCSDIRINNGMIEFSAGSTDNRPVGSTATYICDPGFVVMNEASSVRTCRIDGTWNRYDFSCLANCSDLPDAPTNGMITYSSGSNDARPPESTATYSCAMNYCLTRGDSVRRCAGYIPTWSGTAPVCQDICPCSDLAVPVNGAISYSSRSSGFRSAGSTAKFICDTGYTLTGDKIRTCKNDGTWTEGSEATCQDVTFQLSQDDYSSNEETQSLSITITKNARIARPVTLLLTPYTVNEAIQAGLPLPATLPASDGLSQNHAKSSISDQPDFLANNITVTFSPDEFGPTSNSKEVSIQIIDDDINEATEEYFIVVLSQYDGDNIRPSRRSSLCRIIDNDDIRIGFQSASSTFTEPDLIETEVFILIEKEDNQRTEQTFLVAIDLNLITPNARINLANHSSSFSLNDYSIQFIPREPISIVLAFGPDSQTLELYIQLYADDIIEGTEAFQLCLSPAEEISPRFSSPVHLFNSTFVVIMDADLIACEDTTPLSNGLIFYTDGSTNARPVNVTTAYYSCEAGYYLSGNETRRCQYNRTWSGELPTCEAVSCGFPPSIPNGSPDIASELKYKMTAPYSCDDGFTTKPGLNSSTCTASGNWSTLPVCLSINCQPLPVLENGTIIYTDTQNTTQDYAVGTVASYVCDSDFYLEGEATSTCIGIRNGAVWERMQSPAAVCSESPVSEFDVILFSAILGSLVGMVLLAIIIIIIVIIVVRKKAKPVQELDMYIAGDHIYDDPDRIRAHQIKPPLPSRNISTGENQAYSKAFEMKGNNAYTTASMLETEMTQCESTGSYVNADLGPRKETGQEIPKNESEGYVNSDLGPSHKPNLHEPESEDCVDPDEYIVMDNCNENQYENTCIKSGSFVPFNKN